MNTDLELSRKWSELPVDSETGPEVLGSLAGGFSVEDQQLSTYLLRQVDKTVDLSIPDTINDEDLLKQLTSCMKVYVRMQSVRRLLQPILGRMMLLMETRPELLKHFGVRNIAEFCDTVCPSRFHLQRSEAYFVRKIVRLLPNISPQEYIDAKPVNLKLIGKALNWESSPKASEYMMAAQGKTYDELCEYLAADGVDISEIRTTKITTTVSFDTRKRFEAFLVDPIVQAYCETTSPEQVIIRMLDECESQWVAVQQLRNRIDGNE